MHPEAGGLRIETSRGRIVAAQVVYACHAMLGQFRPALARIMAPIRGQVLLADVGTARFGPAMAVDFGSVYWRQARGGLVVLGGCRSADPSPEQGITGNRVNPRVQAALAAFLPTAFPGLEVVRVRGCWAGLMDQSADARPLVGAVPHHLGEFVIAGFGGHGVPPALGSGRALAALMSPGQTATLPATYDPARVGRLLEGMTDAR